MDSNVGIGTTDIDFAFPVATNAFFTNQFKKASRRRFVFRVTNFVDLWQQMRTFLG